MLPAVIVVENDQAGQIPLNFGIDAVHGLELFPDGADAEGQGNIDAVAAMADPSICASDTVCRYL